MKIETKKLDDVSFITLDNNRGMTIVLSTMGASVYSLELIDKRGNKEAIVMTPSTTNDFYYNDGYHGKTIGRFAGRIDKGKCVINEKEYDLDINWNNENSLHGGNKGISFANFDYEIKENEAFCDVIFTYLEKEDKLPGDVNYKITYRIFKDYNKYAIFYNAKTNKDTLVNLTNHTYFNLSGNARSTILDHYLKLNCNKYTKENENLIATSIDKVNRVMNFQHSHKIKKYINDESLQNHIAKGYDHAFIKRNLEDREIAILYDKKSKRKMVVNTSYPCVVIYTCNYPKDFTFNPGFIRQEKHHAICLECQYIPNGINMDNVNKAILKKDEEYNEYISYSFED